MAECTVTVTVNGIERARTTCHMPNEHYDKAPDQTIYVGVVRAVDTILANIKRAIEFQGKAH